ncbi:MULTISPECIES: hypothetical protein [unclassified Sporosarcina]|uniref:hypothetical protein n=1 Tax=unclassified Sporosarcina TaxID=2647733 RepID=UPI000C162B20|nr:MULTISPECIES: hypothetical protein [unclassified Sporosarcina]PID05045.1 hypothetical protein CSV66_12145 [Sporosarcina sp. P30]PID07585.1 hypothetical protein CSV65_15355 [Sporosarcina sp. P31]PID11799.1 hypothetical protein CSV64_10380 [Sporosarcina sp. P32b]
MPVTQYYPIGSITMPSSWIAFIAGFLVTYLFIRLYFGKVHGARVGDLFFNVVIIWKLSVIVTDFSMVIKNPLSILYFHGGTVGWILGLVVAGLWMLRQVYKEKWKRIDKWTLLLALICWQAIYQIAMAFLNEGNLVVKSTTILLFVAVFVLSWWSEQKKINTVSELAFVLVAVHFLVSAIQGNLLNTAFITTIFIGLFMWGVERATAQPISGKEEVE